MVAPQLHHKIILLLKHPLTLYWTSPLNSSVWGEPFLKNCFIIIAMYFFKKILKFICLRWTLSQNLFHNHWYVFIYENSFFKRTNIHIAHFTFDFDTIYFKGINPTKLYVFNLQILPRLSSSHQGSNSEDLILIHFIWNIFKGEVQSRITIISKESIKISLQIGAKMMKIG